MVSDFANFKQIVKVGLPPRFVGGLVDCKRGVICGLVSADSDLWPSNQQPGVDR